MLAYVLNKQIDGQQILKDIQDLINSKTISSETCILYIDIKKIAHDDHTMIQKIEYKPNNI